VAVRVLRDMERKENRVPFRVCIYPIAVTGSMDRSEREKRNEGNHRGMPGAPVQGLRWPPRGVLILSLPCPRRSFVSPASELAAARV
jgi:hypothetical protein